MNDSDEAVNHQPASAIGDGEPGLAVPVSEQAVYAQIVRKVDRNHPSTTTSASPTTEDCVVFYVTETQAANNSTTDGNEGSDFTRKKNVEDGVFSSSTSIDEEDKRHEDFATSARDKQSVNTEYFRLSVYCTFFYNFLILLTVCVIAFLTVCNFYRFNCSIPSWLINVLYTEIEG